MSTYHIPVMVSETMDGLMPSQGKRFVDATVGGGGHTVELLKRGAIVLGLDADIDAVEFTKRRIQEELPNTKEGIHWIVKQANFRNIKEVARSNGFGEVEGVLFDLGVSSRQLDSETKGFTYRIENGPLDLRFDQTSGMTAREVVNTRSQEELYEIFSKFGEEERARAIAHALVRARSLRNIETVGDIVRIIALIVPNQHEQYAVLSRIFQALRIVVNDEIGALREGLSGAKEIIKSGGRLVVISFHSLEDRVVKQYIFDGTWREITKKPLRARPEEQMRNHRSRSAKLRIAQNL